MPRHDYRCALCGALFEAVLPWNQYTAACVCGSYQAERVYLPTQGVIDDILPGGPRWMHNLGDRPIWVMTKTQLKREMAERGLVPADRAVYNRDDRSPWATIGRLRPGQRDPFVHRGDFNR